MTDVAPFMMYRPTFLVKQKTIYWNILYSTQMLLYRNYQNKIIAIPTQNLPIRHQTHSSISNYIKKKTSNPPHLINSSSSSSPFFALVHTNNFNCSNFFHSKQKKKELAQKYYELLALILNKSPIISVPSTSPMHENDESDENTTNPRAPPTTDFGVLGSVLGN